MTISIKGDKPRVESLAIGDELLDGRVQDGNTRDLGEALAQLGFELQSARTVPDSRATIVNALREAAARSDVVVTSGGLGPTSDDITAASTTPRGQERQDRTFDFTNPTMRRLARSRTSTVAPRARSWPTV